LFTGLGYSAVAGNIGRYCKWMEPAPRNPSAAWHPGTWQCRRISAMMVSAETNLTPGIEVSNLACGWSVTVCVIFFLRCVNLSGQRFNHRQVSVQTGFKWLL